MVETIKQLIKLAAATDKKWLLPIILLLMILSLLVIAAQISPVPLFIYPLI